MTKTGVEKVIKDVCDKTHARRRSLRKHVSATSQAIVLSDDDSKVTSHDAGPSETSAGTKTRDTINRKRSRSPLLVCAESRT